MQIRRSKMLRNTIWPEPPRSRSAPPRSRPPVRPHGGAEIQAGMDGIMAGSTGLRFAAGLTDVSLRFQRDSHEACSLSRQL
jgi:hypothetical protein